MAGIWKAARVLLNSSPQLISSSVSCYSGVSLPATRIFSSCLNNSAHPFVGVNLYNPIIVPQRSTTFFNRLPGERLWKGVTSVSNAGRKRGRGKAVGKKNIRNLNRGQVIGVGPVNMLWPGLNGPVIQGKELIQQQKLPDDPEYKAKLVKNREDFNPFVRAQVPPLQRGWTGNWLSGRSIGSPDPVGEDQFIGFDTKVLEFKTVCNMTGNMGRTRRISAFVITGNSNGLAGFALGKAQGGQAALRKAKNRAAQKLIFIERYKDHTVLHDFYTRFGNTKIFVQKKPEGYGLVCHRAIKTICEVIGIRDLYAKVEGSTKNVQHVTKAFIVGLIRQKSYQQIADETKLHVVEFCGERDNFPKVLASPVKAPANTTKDPETSFDLFIMDGQVPSERKKYPKFYEKLPSWQVHLSKTIRFRNHEKVKSHMMVEYGELRSFLADKYPECRRVAVPQRMKEEID